MTQWICKNGHVFLFVRQGEETRPKECPECGSNELDAREV